MIELGGPLASQQSRIGFRAGRVEGDHGEFQQGICSTSLRCDGPGWYGKPRIDLTHFWTNLFGTLGTGQSSAGTAKLRYAMMWYRRMTEGKNVENR